MNPTSPTTVALLTGGGDRPYALGLASTLVAAGLTFDFIGSDFLDSSELRQQPQVRFLNLRGNMDPDVSTLTKIKRIINYYIRLIFYAAFSQKPIFHILWNNKLEVFDRTLIMMYYKCLGKRLVLTVHNVNIAARDNRDNILNRLTLRVQYTLADHLFVHTERMQRELAEHFRVPIPKITIIALPVNDTVPRTTLNANVARQQLGLAATDQVALFFGHIAPYKGLEYLVEAIALVRPRLPDLRLVIAGRPKGSQDYWASVESRISELNLNDVVVVRSEFIPDAEIEVYFKAADILVLPYVFIYQSGVLFLSYNFGLPVIATDVGDLRDYIVAGTTGWLCRPRDPHDLANALIQYFTSDRYRQLPATRAEIEAYAHQTYSWTHVGEVTRQLYEKLLQN